MTTTHKKIILATRNSRLAMWQANHVKQCLQTQYPQLTIDIAARTTTGDKKKAVSLSAIGGKNLFTKELQSALLNDEADIAVHSVKDLAAKTPTNLTLAAILTRGDARDAFLSTKSSTLATLPTGAIVGTASPRRQSQLLALRPDLSIQLLRGNIDTRLKKLDDNQYDAIILAAAGLTRLGLADRISEYFTADSLLPAIGQGAIGIECRANDHETQTLLSTLNDPLTASCVSAERAVNAHLGGDCFTPIAAHATCHDAVITLKTRIGALDGSIILNANVTGAANKAVELGTTAAIKLLEQGAARLLQND